MLRYFLNGHLVLDGLILALLTRTTTITTHAGNLDPRESSQSLDGLVGLREAQRI